ncbi:MAG: hypothetical protein WDO73_08270 [Ignavibacteriota bacterium]
MAHILNGKLLLDGTEPRSRPDRRVRRGAQFAIPQERDEDAVPGQFSLLMECSGYHAATQSGDDPRWIHYDGNTNSILERNIGQGLGMGAVFDPKTYESTLRIANLHRLEVLTHRLQPPVWPSDILGAIDQTKAQKGEVIFKTKCEGCHQDRLYALTDVQTDPMRANSFGQPVGGTPFPRRRGADPGRTEEARLR